MCSSMPKRAGSTGDRTNAACCTSDCSTSPRPCRSASQHCSKVPPTPDDLVAYVADPRGIHHCGVDYRNGQYDGPAVSSGAGAVKRTLPVRVDPIPGEALESWLGARGTRRNAPWGEVLDVVLPMGANGIASGHRGAVLTSGVSDAERESISAATG